MFFGATLIVALVALATVGPVPAIIVWLVPDLIARFVLRTRAPHLALASSPTSAASPSPPSSAPSCSSSRGSPGGAAIAPSLYAAGVAMWAVNFAVARLAFAPFYQGYRPAAMIRDEFFDLAPAVLGMLLVGRRGRGGR